MDLAIMNGKNNLVVADGEEIKISGRELHMLLEVVTPYHKWFPRMCEYGFTEGTDFLVTDKNVHNSNGGKQNIIDHLMTVDMAKEISMLQRSEKGKQARQYFIQLEKDWNSPEKVMARALNIAKKTLATVSIRLDEANKQLEEQKPMVVFANAVTASSTSILVGELAKLLKQNGFNFGQNRLFDWLRSNGYLMKSGCSRNMPTQRAMELGLFEVKETSVATPYGTRLNRTTKITGKGQIYFINKFKGMQGGVSLNDDVGMYCDVCASSVQVRHYHAIDMDLCDKCKPMLIDLIEEAENGIINNSDRGTSSAGATTV